jgi:hypothetical protein
MDAFMVARVRVRGAGMWGISAIREGEGWVAATGRYLNCGGERDRWRGSRHFGCRRGSRRRRRSRLRLIWGRRRGNELKWMWVGAERNRIGLELERWTDRYFLSVHTFLPLITSV